MNEPKHTPKFLPFVMVLTYQPELTCSVWMDYFSRKRSRKALLAELRKEVKAGRFVGYRLIEIDTEVIGLEPKAALAKAQPEGEK